MPGRRGYRSRIVRLPRKIWVPLASVAACVLLAPGWRGRLSPAQVSIPHAATVTGASRAGEADGEDWHASYVGRPGPTALGAVLPDAVLLRVFAPDYVAHIPPGSVKADGYFAVEQELHWPWWRPGGGLDWRVPTR